MKAAVSLSGFKFYSILQQNFHVRAPPTIGGLTPSPLGSAHVHSALPVPAHPQSLLLVEVQLYSRERGNKRRNHKKLDCGTLRLLHNSRPPRNPTPAFRARFAPAVLISFRHHSVTDGFNDGHWLSYNR